MKKTFLFISILWTSIILYAGGYGISYLQPMPGSGGIPMNPYSGHYSPLNTYYSEGFDPYVEGSPKELAYGHYTTDEIIALGGVKNLGYDEAKKGSYTLTATCDNGFFFVSQSNPSYRRPFELYVIPRATIAKIAGGGPRTGAPKVLSNQNTKITADYNSIVSGLIPVDEKNRKMWFDLVLVLPGEIKGSDCIYKNVTYPLKAVDDYSAVVNLTLQAEGNEPISISIPFSGSFSATPKEKSPASVSMYVHPLPSAGNLDIKNTAEQPVADLNIQGVYPYDKSNPGSAPKQNFALFLSSNSSPYVEKAEKFTLVNESWQYPQPKTSFNSIEYRVVLRDSMNSANQVIYDGTSRVDNGINRNQNLSKKYPFLIIPGNVAYDQSHATGVMTYTFVGTASVMMNETVGKVMQAGRYTSTIYVHVINIL